MLFAANNAVPRCPDCWTDMDFLVSQTTGRVFLSTLLKRAFFVCPNCGCLSYEVVLRPKEFIRSDAAQIFTDRLGRGFDTAC
jgi:hypothetical protein